MNAKRVKFERTGGFAGMRIAADFELDDLPKEQARQLRELLDEVDFDELPKKLTDEEGVADGFTYSITVETDKGRHSVTTGSAPKQLEPLLDLLNQIARQQMRKQ